MTVLLPSLSSDNKVLASEEGLIEKFCSGIIMILSVLTGDLTVQERLVRSLWWPTRSQSGVLRVKATFWTSTGEWPGSVYFPPARVKILNWQGLSDIPWHYDTMTLWHYDTMTRSLWHPMTIHVMPVTPTINDNELPLSLCPQFPAVWSLSVVQSPLRYWNM